MDLPHDSLRYFVLGSSRHKDGRIVQNPSLECYMSASFKQGSVKHRSGSRSGHKGKVVLPNNETLHSRHATHVSRAILGVECDDDADVAIRITVWPKTMKIKSTCIIMVNVSQ